MNRVGIHNPMFGRHHTEQSKKQISESQKKHYLHLKKAEIKAMAKEMADYENSLYGNKIMNSLFSQVGNLSIEGIIQTLRFLAIIISESSTINKEIEKKLKNLFESVQENLAPSVQRIND